MASPGPPQTDASVTLYVTTFPQGTWVDVEGTEGDNTDCKNLQEVLSVHAYTHTRIHTKIMFISSPLLLFLLLSLSSFYLQGCGVQRRRLSSGQGAVIRSFFLVLLLCLLRRTVLGRTRKTSSRFHRRQSQDQRGRDSSAVLRSGYDHSSQTFRAGEFGALANRLEGFGLHLLWPGVHQLLQLWLNQVQEWFVSKAGRRIRGKFSTRRNVTEGWVRVDEQNENWGKDGNK